LFTPSKKGDDKLKNGDLGSGRAIPFKQGYLYKDWKKKYIMHCDDGHLIFCSRLHVSFSLMFRNGCEIEDLFCVAE
jgi:Arf-GAP/GTPase/ANK repeat/PH domain-containing protein 1/3